MLKVINCPNCDTPMYSGKYCPACDYDDTTRIGKPPPIFNCPNCGNPMYKGNACIQCDHDASKGAECDCDYCSESETPLQSEVGGKA